MENHEIELNKFRNGDWRRGKGIIVATWRDIMIGNNGGSVASEKERGEGEKARETRLETDDRVVDIVP